MPFVSGLEHFIRENEPLAPYNWLRLGGPAQYLAEPTTQEELVTLVQRARQEDLPVRLLGGGSNVLIPDQGVKGVVILLASPAFGQVEIQGKTLIAGGGVQLGHVISTAVREGLGGLEQLAGIPGTIGGALHGNAGSTGGDIGQWTSQATVLTRSGELLTRTRDEMRFAYRQSSLDELVITEARFELEPESPDQLTRRLQKVWIVKRARQPSGDQRAAYLFRSAQGISAATLIDQAELKGAEIGKVRLSEQNSNFLIAADGATSEQVMQLVELVKSQVASKLDIQLEPTLDLW